MSRFPRAIPALAAAMLILPGIARGQGAAPKPRPELSDSARRVARGGASTAPITRPAPRRGDVRDSADRGSTGTPRRETATNSRTFVRDQTILGLGVYGPSFAATTANDPIAWTAGYVVVGGGSYFAASQLARDITITGPMSDLATRSAVRGGATLLTLAWASNVSRHARAGALFFGSLGGTAAGLYAGRHMTAGEAAATVFGADFAGLGALAATHISSPVADPKYRIAVTAASSLVGYPIGYAYARSAKYNVTDGDITALWTSAAIGATAGGAFVASGRPDARAVATALGAGALAGAIVGDRVFVRRADHTGEEGGFLAMGAVAGGLMGAGVGILTGAAHDRVSVATAALTAGGAAAGAWWTEYYLVPHADAGKRLGALTLQPAGILGALSGQPGIYPLARLTF